MAKIGVLSTKNWTVCGPSTFMNIPHSTDFSKASAVVLGVPYDGGLHPTRIGSRTGPAAIREQSQLVRPFQPPHAKFNPLELLNVVDCGDADTTPSIIGDSFKEIEEVAHEIFVADAAPLAFGGDGNITLPLLRAAHKFYPNLVVLHVDAHTDTYRGDGNGIICATMLRQPSLVQLKKVSSMLKLLYILVRVGQQWTMVSLNILATWAFNLLMVTIF